MGFHLTKWYLDAIAPDGSALIGYWARLSWGVLAVRYSAVLRVPADADQPVAEETSLLLPSEPKLNRGELAWRVPRLKVDARWTLDGPSAVRRGGIAHELHDGAVKWECVAPVARVHGLTGLDGGAANGGASRTHMGYAERLALEVEPWKLPIDELRWGRVAHADVSVVWIEWRGPSPVKLVFVNGVAQGAAQIADDAVAWQGGKILLAPRRVIRQASLEDGPVAQVPMLADALPPRILSAHETKWLSEATLPSGARTLAIHEVVRFGS